MTASLLRLPPSLLSVFWKRRPHRGCILSWPPTRHTMKLLFHRPPVPHIDTCHRMVAAVCPNFSLYKILALHHHRIWISFLPDRRVSSFSKVSPPPLNFETCSFRERLHEDGGLSIPQLRGYHLPTLRHTKRRRGQTRVPPMTVPRPLNLGLPGRVHKTVSTAAMPFAFNFPPSPSRGFSSSSPMPTLLLYFKNRQFVSSLSQVHEE